MDEDREPRFTQVTMDINEPTGLKRPKLSEDKDSEEVVQIRTLIDQTRRLHIDSPREGDVEMALDEKSLVERQREELQARYMKEMDKYRRQSKTAEKGYHLEPCV